MDTYNILQNISDYLMHYPHFINKIPLSTILSNDSRNNHKEKDKEKIKNISAEHCICSAIFRIRDIYDYLKNYSHPDSYAEFISYIIQIDGLISCTKILYQAFDIKEEQHDEIFLHKEQAGYIINDKINVNDIHYFQYIRSLCFTHPLETNRHPKFQNGNFEWCLMTDPINSNYYFNNPDKPDFTAEVLTSENNTIKKIPLYINEFEKYAQYYFSLLPTIKTAIEKFIENQKNKYRDKLISPIAKFTNYTDYLYYLYKEEYKRYNSDEYGLYSIIILFEITPDKDSEIYFNQYRSYVKKQIAILVNKMQNMEDDIGYFKSIISDKTRDMYLSQKMEYLFKFPNNQKAPYSLNDIIGTARLSGIENEVKLINYFKSPYSDNKERLFGKTCTNSEWTRALLQRCWDLLNKNFNLNIYASDWHVYWQIEIACYYI